MCKKKDHTVNYTIYDSLDSLPEAYVTAYLKSIEAIKLSYAPYSNFHVGSALVSHDGETIVLGANQENSSYPLCLCAERVAIHNANMNHPNVVFSMLAVSVQSEHNIITSPVSPCGACRQVISEFEQRQGSPIKIILSSNIPHFYIFESIQDLLPFSFNSDYLL